MGTVSLRPSTPLAASFASRDENGSAKRRHAFAERVGAEKDTTDGFPLPTVPAVCVLAR
jgi:hypothetical protein